MLTPLVHVWVNPSQTIQVRLIYCKSHLVHVLASLYQVSIFEFLIKRLFIQVPTCLVYGQWFFIVWQVMLQLLLIPGGEKPLTKALNTTVMKRLNI